MPLNNILKNAHRLDLVAECSLNNTLSVPWDFSDMNCGPVENCGAQTGVHHKSNGIVNLSNNQINGLNSTMLLSRGCSVTLSLPDAQSGSAAAVSYAPITALNVDGVDDLSKRRFKGTPVTVKAGGLINKGKINEQELDYSEFEPWIEGVFVGKDGSADDIDLTIGLKSDDLTAKFPPRTHKKGDSEGLPMQIIYGMTTCTAQSIGDGFHHFHDGIVDLDNDSPIDASVDFTAISLGEGHDYWHELRFGKYIPESASGTTVTKSGINWTIDSTTKASTTDAGGIGVELSEGLEVSAGGSNELSFSLDGSQIQKYDLSDFNWVLDDDGEIKNTKGPDFKVDITSGLAFEEVRNRFFKIETATSGTVTITAPEGFKIKSAKLVIRSIDTSIQTIDNWSTVPNQVTPAFSNTNENHTAHFSSLNEESISFDYTSAFDEQKVAVWFEEVEIYEVKTKQVTVNFTDNSGDIDLALYLNNSSQRFLVSAPAPDSTPSNDLGENVFTISDETKVVTFDLEIGHGDVLFYINSTTHNYDFYGVTYENNVVTISPPAVGGGDTVTDLYGLFSELTPFDGPYSDTSLAISTKYRIEVECYIDSNNVDEAYFSVTGSSGASLYVNINPKIIGLAKKDIDTYVFEVFSSDLTPLGFGISELKIATWRGSMETLSGIFDNKVNADEDFSLKITNITVTPQGRYNSNGKIIINSDIRLFDASADTRIKIPSFQVNKASKYKNKLPTGLALYDRRGKFAVSPLYDSSKLIGDFRGSDKDITLVNSFKDMSKKATGLDLVTFSGTSYQVGFCVKERKNWATHVGEYCKNAHLFYQENLVGDGITVKERWNYTDSPTLFTGDYNIHESFNDSSVPDTLQQIIVEYRQDELDPSRTRRIESRQAPNSKLEPWVINSPYYLESTNQDLADLITKYSAYVENWEGQLIGIGHGLELGGVYRFDDDSLPNNKGCEITEITEEDLETEDMRMTIIKFKVYQ